LRVPGTLVDTNVLLDVITDDPQWSEWSSDALVSAIDDGPIYINTVIYAEVSVRFSRIEELEHVLPSKDFRRASIPWDAAFLAGKAFTTYRRRGGTKASTLPDFFIGAHAAVSDLGLLTRDAARYRTYFPTIRLRTPS
jgi:predicted nucleic acid-binding protein